MALMKEMTHQISMEWMDLLWLQHTTLSSRTSDTNTSINEMFNTHLITTITLYNNIVTIMIDGLDYCYTEKKHKVGQICCRCKWRTNFGAVLHPERGGDRFCSLFVASPLSTIITRLKGVCVCSQFSYNMWSVNSCRLHFPNIFSDNSSTSKKPWE